ncbi:MAG: cation-translocating P-type ATPase [Chloroflexi bacterium]|nr:cation-translocating P-type ATPase [Chloroflexota bacterium]
MALATDENQADAYRLAAEAVVASLGSDPRRGLTAATARDRLAQHGPNVLPAPPATPVWRKLLAQFEGPLTLLLLLATAVSFVVWLVERDAPVPYEALTILAIVVLNALLGFVQEHRAEQAVDALKAMSAPSARVVRDGQPQQIATADVTPGDILLIEEGDTLPADARVLESIAMRVAEATLTGESAAVAKDSAPISEEVGIGDRLNMVFSGTAVATGRGRAIVTATGSRTEIGKIAASLHETEPELTPLQRELDQVGRLLGVIVIAIAVVVSVAIIFIAHVSSFTEFVDVMLLAVSLAVAAVPEGLTAITTIVLSLGMQRMARRQVIVRKLAAVETLGSTTVIATDKTGTLTRNEMTVRTVVTAGGRVDLTGAGYEPAGEARQNGQPIADEALRHELQRTLRAASMANNAFLREQDGRWTVQGDPTEGALIVAARKVALSEADLHNQFPRIGEVPFSSDRKLMSTAHADATRDDRVVVFAKGAPDVLLARCTDERVGETVRPLDDARRATIEADDDALAGEALRTLGIAYRTLRSDATTGALTEDDEQNLVWLGVVGLSDPPRPEAAAAVATARASGIRPVMITGDHPATAAAIAAEIGLAGHGEPAVTGAALQVMDDDRLREITRTASVYARVAPEHKLRIVRALKANGEIAAMTGDGVNDAPALRASDIGVAMGITGTDVAKGAADMVLADDNFASIVAAVEEGRSIFANIQKFLRYLLSSNIGEVLVMFFGVVLAGVIGLTPEAGSAIVVPLLATQILWINLLTDAGPALALGIDPADPAVMSRPPRDPRQPVIDRGMWVTIGYVGAIMAIGTLLVMDWALPGGLIPDGQGSMRYAQTMAFTTLVFYQLFNVFNARSNDVSAVRGLAGNPWLWVAIGISIALQVLVIYTPFLQTAFHTTALSLNDWLVCAVVGSSVLWLVEVKKLVARQFRQSRGLKAGPSLGGAV